MKKYHKITFAALSALSLILNCSGMDYQQNSNNLVTPPLTTAQKELDRRYKCIELTIKNFNSSTNSEINLSYCAKNATELSQNNILVFIMDFYVSQQDHNKISGIIKEENPSLYEML